MENKSTHKAEVVKLTQIYPHPDTEVTRMEVAKVFGWECCIGKGQFKCGDLAVFIQPDSIVPPEKQYEFLKKPEDGVEFPRKRRIIRAKRLRKVWSAGLLVYVPNGIDAKEGDDLAEIMKIEHYEPEVQSEGSGGGGGKTGETEKGPSGIFPYYDVDNYRRYSHIFKEGEEIVATEKTHGACGLFVYQNNRFWVRSRNNWKRPSLTDRAYFAETLWEKVMCRFYVLLKKFRFFKLLRKLKVNVSEKSDWWWEGLRNSPELCQFLKAHPGSAVYGEVYGKTQKLHYGIPDKCQIACFDIMQNGQWLSWKSSQQLAEDYKLPWVPVVYRGPLTDKICEYAEGKSLIPGAENIREGVVVKPITERRDDRGNRVQLKIVSNEYLGKTE
jgi:RNA ligase (TIGR02306 family)